MPVVQQPGGNMFLPQVDPGATDQQPAQGALGQIMPGAAAAPGQPAQTPQEHAQNKQGWLDWLRDPSVSSFLMQFGASMLQPNVRGFGAQLGQSLGEGGEAAARVAAGQRAQEQSEADVREKGAQADYYAAEAKARPTLTAAQEALSQAKLTAAESKASVADQMMYFNQQRDAALAANDRASADRYQAMADQLALQAKYPGLKGYWTALDQWQKDYDQAVSTGLTPPPRPKPEDFGVPGTAIGLGGGPAATTTSTSTAPDLAKTAPIPADNPDFVNTVRGMSADERANYTRIYYDRGGKQWTTWQTVLDRLKEPGAGQPPIVGRGPPPVAPQTVGPTGRVDPNAPLNQKILQTIQSGGGL